jgi:hypothetical protein
VADAERTWRALVGDPSTLDNLATWGVGLKTIGSWHDQALRHWLLDSNFGPSDLRGRRQISEVTGNWPVLLHDFYRSARAEDPHWLHALENLERSLQQPEEARRYLDAFGLRQRIDAAHALRTLSQYGRSSIDELGALIDSTPSLDLVRILRWANLLGLVHRVANAWEINPLVGRLLEASGE